MDPEQLAQLLQSFQTIAESNKQLMANMQATAAVVEDTTGTGTTRTQATASRDAAANVALTSIKVPLDMGDDAEERLVNFHEWTEEVRDKLKVANVGDLKLQTTLALMWGGKDIKDYAVEKAGVQLHDDNTGNAPVEADTWNDAVEKIRTVMEEGINESFAMFKFRQQEQGQRSINHWHKELKSSVKTLRLGRCTCGHGYSEDRAIRDVMIERTNDSKLRKDGLSKDLSLADVLKEGEANELARSRAATVEGKSTVNKLLATATGDSDDDEALTEEEEMLMVAKLRKAGKYSIKANKKNTECERCTYSSKNPHTSESCYFKDKVCRVCKKTGHMGGAKLCKATVKVNKLLTQGDFKDQDNWHHQEDGEVLKSSSMPREIILKKVNTTRKNIAKVKVGNTNTEMFTDSGVKVNVAPSSWYRKDMGKLQEADLRLIGYGSKTPLPVTAKFRTKITTPKGATKETWIYVVDVEGIEPLMGDLDATDLGFLVFNPDGREPTEFEVRKVGIKEGTKIGEGTMPEAQDEPQISEKERLDCRKIINSPKYATIFDGHIGKMVKRTPITLHGDDGRRIVNQPYRTPPPQFHKELSDHLQHLRDNGKIVDVDPNCEKVETSSNVVLTRKSDGRLRMNIDATPINRAAAEVIQPHMTTPEEVRHKISGSTRYSEFDMNHGYNQSTLCEESSRKYGVFQTHEGFHRFTSLYFGHCQAAQAFDQDVKTSLCGLQAAESVADNILVHSKTERQHKQDLTAFLDRCLEEGITLKKEKTKTCQKEILWFGYVYGRDGVRPDPAKTQKLKEKGPPCNQEEVRSFLQAAQFNAKFMWNTDGAYANTTQPLRRLLRKDTAFTWGAQEEASYKEIIHALESAGALYPYNPELDLCHVADAQPHGIGSSVYMITRDKESVESWWPLNHASRSLTRTESSYPQIDRESLAQAWGMRQHRFYLLGRQFTTYCDHKPLVPFYNGKKKPTPRVEKHILSIQDLKYKMEFIPGKGNPADWNSRHP